MDSGSAEAAGSAGPDELAGLASLDDPVRRRLYDHVAGLDDPVTRDDAAAAAGISRTLAAYHLDKLAEAGLLSTTYARPEGVGGPGAGRPAKRYRRAQRELAVSVPPRNYGLLAELLVEAAAGETAAEQAKGGPEPVGGGLRAGIEAAARRAGRAAGDEDGVMAALARCGYEPAAIDDGGIELRNCPFHRLAETHTELVCGLNLALVAGVLEGAGQAPQRARLAPRPQRCCVLVGAPEPARARRGLRRPRR